MTHNCKADMQNMVKISVLYFLDGISVGEHFSWVGSSLPLFKIFRNITKLGLPRLKNISILASLANFKIFKDIERILQNWSHLRLKNISILVSLASLHLFRIICLLLTQLHLGKKTLKLRFFGGSLFVPKTQWNQRNWNKFPSCSQEVDQSLCCHFQG